MGTRVSSNKVGWDLFRSLLFNRWIASVWIAGVLAFCLIYLAPLLVAEPNLEEIRRHFTADAFQIAKPEPLEQLRYVLCISLVSFIYYVLSVLENAVGGEASTNFSSKGKSRSNEIQSWKSRWLDEPVVTVIIQMLYLVFFIFFGISQQDSIYEYFQSWQIFGALILGTLFTVSTRSPAASGMPKWMEGWKTREATVWIVAILILVLELLPCLFTDDNLKTSHTDVSYHLPFTISEFIAVLQGKTPLIDFFPQYHNLLPILFSPIFNFIGIDTFKYSAVMVAFSFIALVGVFQVFKALTRNRGWAMLLFLSFVGYSFYPFGEHDAVRSTNFNYFANWPLRFMGPSFLAYLISRYYRFPSVFTLFALYFTGGLVALNNLEMGVPACVGVIACTFLATPPRRSIQDICRQIELVFSGLISSVAVFTFIIWIRSHQIPDFIEIISYQRAFASWGFGMFPAPLWGYHGIIYLTFMASLISALWLRNQKRGNDEKTQSLEIALLSYGAVFGCGAMMYYIGRTHPAVLTAIFSPWAFSLLVLFWVWRKSFVRPLGIIPGVMLSSLVILGVLQLSHLSNPSQEFERLQIVDSVERNAHKGLVEFIRQAVPNLNSFAMIYPNADLILWNAGIKNQFSFSHPRSLITIRQIDKAISLLVEKKVTTVLGLFSPEVSDRLKEKKYVLSTELLMQDGSKLELYTHPGYP